jgi:hypothetical protein
MVAAVKALSRLERKKRFEAFLARTGTPSSKKPPSKAEKTGGSLSPIRPDVDAHELLRQVVVAVINHGHASDVHEFPDVLAYFNATVPS